MRIIETSEPFHIETPTAVSIGKFDGMHLGHKALIGDLLKQKEKGLKTAVLTFHPSPEAFFSKGTRKELSTREEKRRQFAKMGVDVLVELAFNEVIAATPPEAFIEDILVKQMHAAYIAAGPDLSYGDKGKGDFALLEKLAGKFGYETEMIPKVRLDGKEISSTYVRSLVQAGKMEEAARALGEPYSVIGRVRHGRALGRRIHIPTANQVPEERKLLPPFGVYYSIVTTGGKEVYGMTNIGTKPTVNDTPEVTIETYLYDFEGDIYDSEIETRLLTWKRPEKRFSGVEDLKQAMLQDLEDGRRYFQEH